MDTFHAVKLDLKDACFSVPLHQESQKYVKFQCKQQLYQFLCLCFGLVSAPRVFTKLMKVITAILRRLILLLILYLDDILLIATSQNELITARDTLIFLLQNLDFLLNLEKSVLQPLQSIEFSGIVVDSRYMTRTLPQEKVNATIDQCQLFLLRDQVTVWEIPQLIGKLSYSGVAVLPAPLHCRSLQRQRIFNAKKL